MVLDNADNAGVFHPHRTGKAALSSTSSDQKQLASFLPKSRNGMILVTSRSMDAAEQLTGNQNNILSIKPMDDGQALELLRRKLAGDCGDCAADLLHALGHIPLAITQAAAYIN